MIDESIVINTPRKILWCNGKVQHYLPFCFYDFRSTLNGEMYWLIGFNLKQINIFPQNFNSESKEKAFLADSLEYKELVANMEALLETWQRFDILHALKYSNQSDNRYEALIKYLAPGYWEMYNFYQNSTLYDVKSDISSLMLLNNIEQRCKSMREKIESRYSGDEYYTYPLRISTINE
jgi:hypothetical protein